MARKGRAGSGKSGYGKSGLGKSTRRKAGTKSRNVWVAALLCLLVLLGFWRKQAAENTDLIRDLIRDTVRDNVQETETVTPVGEGELQVHFLDVGQGDCTLVICGEHAMLIDAGDNSKGTAVQLYLTKQGISSLDYVIGTHPDSDHIGGLDVVISKFDCGMILMPDREADSQTYRDVTDAMKSRGYENTLPVVGQQYSLGEAVITIIAPNRTDYEKDNDFSIGIRLQYGATSFLFTGDAEETAEQDICENGLTIQSDVLQVGHHGSRTSTSEEFLRAVNPTYAVISCGADNSYGHPHAEVLNRLRSAGCQVYRTDEQGTVIAVSDGETITFNSAASDSWLVGEGAGADTDGAGQADEITYILNTRSHKFHRSDCESVAELSDRNKESTTLSREELIAQGYEPCGNCNP